MSRGRGEDRGADPVDAWDFDGQRQDTEWMIRDLARRKEARPGQRIDLDIQFLPAESRRPASERLVAALRRAGFEAHLYEEGDGTPVVEATAEGAAFDLDSIWTAERLATEIALRHGFEPEGWGFAEGPED